ncbi:MAG: prolyl oligopeptidase family serine peptidase [Bacteroidales bacterium]|nr:prolyl oligopeptidase family serine peptidase [Bacteroidales bacterium]
MKQIIILTLIALLLPQTASYGQKKELTKDDYASWQILRSFSLSEQGDWLGWQVSLIDGDDTLYVQRLTDELEYRYPLIGRWSFSDDSKWMAGIKNLSKNEREKATEQKKEVKNDLMLVNLESGDKREFSEVRNFSFTKGSGHLILEGYTDKEKKTYDITLLSLSQGTLKNIGNVLQYSLNKQGDLLAYIISAPGNRGNGVELFSLDNYNITILDSDTTGYARLSWEKEGKALSFLKEISDTGYIETNHILYAVTGIGSNLMINSLHPVKQDVLPEDMRIRETYTPRYSKDLSILYFGGYDWTLKPETKKNGKTKLPGVDIWHWKDDPIQPRQEVEYNQGAKEFTYLFAWNMNSGKVNRITDSKFREGNITSDGKHVVIRTDEPYKPAFRMPRYDHYIVNSATGESKEIIKNFTSLSGSSPDGKYILYFKDKNWFIYDIAASQHRNLTADIPAELWNVRDDSPKDIKPPFGTGGWYSDDTHLLVYDEYDIWKVPSAGGSVVKLTEGREKEVIYRSVRLSREDNFFKPDEDLYISMRGDKTKKSGYARLSPKGKYEELLFEDMAISSLSKAEKSDVFAFRKEAFDNSPDLFVTDNRFRNPEQVSATNPQQSDFYWGKSELVDFTSRKGDKLQGALYYPANYDPEKKYPMIVYIYEIRSAGLHSYTAPSLTSGYNTTNYNARGYFVYQPDIVYETNQPGESAADCVIPAVEEIIKRGIVDEKAIGLVGHSWGAYQTSFIITKTDLFSAAVAGAPLINMISMYNEIYWNSGSPNQNIFETSQGRLREPWWNLMDEYIANSPMFNADKIVTPLMIAFGTKDGAVDWHQGIEMFTTMRRMEKPFIMLVYEGENHSLRIEENMKDYAHRVHHFFDHHLKGKEAEEWISTGRTFIEKKKEEEITKQHEK